MSCTVRRDASAAHHYRIITTYIADPARDAVLMRTSFQGPASRIGCTCGSTRSPAGPAAAAATTQNAGGNTAELVEP